MPTNPVRLLLGQNILSHGHANSIQFLSCTDGSGQHQIVITLSLQEENPVNDPPIGDPSWPEIKAKYRDVSELGTNLTLNGLTVELEKTDPNDIKGGAILTVTTGVGLKVPGTAFEEYVFPVKSTPSI